MVRRAISIAAIAVALPLWFATAPVWVPVTILIDGAGGHRQFPMLRLGCAAGVYLAHGWAAVGTTGWLWLTGGFGRRLDLEAHRRLQGWWANSLLGWARYLLRIDIEPIDHQRLPSSTFILLSRHASMADAVLPAALVAGKMGRFVHYVIKRELRWEPAVDIVGTRIGNHFVTRGGDTGSEARAIERLAAEAAPGSVLVIFPEGTYATPQRRARVVESLRRRGDGEGAARAERLQHLLPPRAAGTLALLRGRPDADVVVLGHAGLEGVAQLRGLRRRLPVRHPVRVEAWLHPRNELPTDEAGLTRWLHHRWEELDRWVGASHGER